MLLGVLALHLVAPPSSWAICEKDADCDDGRLCREGLCMLPAAVDAAAEEPAPTSSGWAMGAGVAGLFAAAAVAANGVVSGASTDNEIMSLPFGVASLAILTITAPIVFAGGKSARVDGQVSGISVLRIFGWILYGVAVGVGGISYAIAGTTDDALPPELVYTVTLGGAVGELFMAIDAMVSHTQAKTQNEALLGAADLPSIVPIVSVVPGIERGSVVGTVGFGAAF